MADTRDYLHLIATAVVNPVKPSDNLCTTRFNIHKFYVLHSQFIYVFCVDLRTGNSSLYSIICICCLLFASFQFEQNVGN